MPIRCYRGFSQLATHAFKQSGHTHRNLLETKARQGKNMLPLRGNTTDAAGGDFTLLHQVAVCTGYASAPKSNA